MRKITALVLTCTAAFALLAALLLATRRVAQASAPHAVGTTYVVNSTADTVDADVGAPACADATGHCTLRAAIMQANFTAGADTITLPAGVYTLDRPGADDADVLGDLDISDDLTIQGAGSGVTIVDGNGAVTGDRVFQIFSTAKQTSLSGLTLRNGKRTATFDEGGGLYWDGNSSHLQLNDVVIERNTGYYGGGIYLNYSTLGDSVDMTHVVLYANRATAAAGGLGANFGDFAQFDLLSSQVYSNTAYEGGGIYFQGSPAAGLSSVRIEDSEAYLNTAGLSAGFENHSGSTSVPVLLLKSKFYNNRAGFYGGAVGNYGVLGIYTSTLEANSASSRGGGLYIYEGGKVDMAQSTLSGNQSESGGGIYSELFIHNSAALTMTNSTLSGNIASHNGGGVFAVGGFTQLFNDTVANNQVLVPLGVTYAGLGGGLYITGTASLLAQNTILADNTHRYGALLPVQDDCLGSINPRWYNLIETTVNCTFTGSPVNNITGVDPMLGRLQYNGGPTQTQPPLAGSPAIDAGQMPNCTGRSGSISVPITVDQRGFHRPYNARCDIGAVEVAPLQLYLPFVRR